MLAHRGGQHPVGKECPEGIEFPFDGKNPKKPVVSWHTIFPRKVRSLMSHLAMRGPFPDNFSASLPARLGSALGKGDFTIGPRLG